MCFFETFLFELAGLDFVEIVSRIQLAAQELTWVARMKQGWSVFHVFLKVSPAAPESSL